MHRFLVIAILTAGTLSAQAPAKEKVDAFFAERTRLTAESKKSFDREMAREKAGECQNANTTLEINQCLGAELAKSKANHDAYVATIRALLSLKNPYDTAMSSDNEERLREFESAAAQWSKYSDEQCKAAHDLFKGGSIAPSVSMTCETRLLRAHMRILDAVYADTFMH